jgi:cell division septation protein DedD
MTNDDDSLPKSEKDRAQQPGFDRDAYTAEGERETRREPVFSGFEDDDEYEEPDRDTDYASAYVDEDLEGDFELPEDDDFESDLIDELEDAEDALDSRDDSDPWPTPKQRREDNGDDPVDEDDEFLDTEENTAEDDREWQEEYEEQAAAWPLALIAVAVLAIVLLAAGGYGVMQQRSATQEEIRELRAQLATAAPPEEVSASRDAQRQLKQRNVEMSMALESLQLENRRLSDTVKGLESQLDAQQKALVQPEPAKPAPTVAKPKPTPVPAKTAAASTGGNWFVNFSSYSQRAAADSWAAKLKPSAGRAVVTTGSKDGKTIYRVRVIGLANRESAQKLAGQLETQYGLSKLWVGQQ